MTLHSSILKICFSSYIKICVSWLMDMEDTVEIAFFNKIHVNNLPEKLSPKIIWWKVEVARESTILKVFDKCIFCPEVLPYPFSVTILLNQMYQQPR